MTWTSVLQPSWDRFEFAIHRTPFVIHFHLRLECYFLLVDLPINTPVNEVPAKPPKQSICVWGFIRPEFLSISPRFSNYTLVGGAESQIDYRSTENDMGTGKEGGGVWNWIRDFSALLFVVSVEINTGQQKRNSIGGGSVWGWNTPWFEIDPKSKNKKKSYRLYSNMQII